MSLIEEGAEKTVRMAHLAVVGIALGQRRGRAAHRSAEERSVPRLLRAVAGAIQQQDQRRHAAALAARCATPGWRRPSPRRIGDRLATRPRRSSKRLEPLADDAAFRAQLPRRQARRTRTRLAAHHRRAAAASPSIPTRSSTCRSSASTSTSGSCSTCCTSSRSTTASRTTATSTMVPRTVHLRRQGGARLLDGQARSSSSSTSVADVVNGDRDVGGRSRSRSCRTTASRSPSASSRRPTCPSRSRRPARRRPAPAT